MPPEPTENVFSFPKYKNTKENQREDNNKWGYSIVHDCFDFVLTTIIESSVREIENDSIVCSRTTKVMLCGHGVDVNSKDYIAPESLQFFYVRLPILVIAL